MRDLTEGRRNSIHVQLRLRERRLRPDWTMALVLAIFLLLKPGFASAHSSAMNPQNLWVAGYTPTSALNINYEAAEHNVLQCESDAVNATMSEGPFFSSPADFENSIKNHFDYAVELFASEFGNIYEINGGFFPNSSCYGIGFDSHNPVSFPLTYVGNNFGKVCGDGSYAEGGQTCDVPSQVAKQVGDTGPDCTCEKLAGDPITIASGNVFVRVRLWP